jgi:hypothetical protein
MASWADLKELRLKTCDPDGYIDLETVATAAALPGTPKGQTAYRKEDSGEYVAYDAELLSWEPVRLEVSDARLMAMIDTYGGVSKAAPYAVRQIMAGLGARLRIARTQGGAESTDFVNLTTLYNFYKDLIASMTEEVAQEAGESQGRMLRIRTKPIAGGMWG